MRQSLGSGTSKFSKRLARRFEEAAKDELHKADDEDLLLAYVLYSQKHFIRRLSGEEFMAQKPLKKNKSHATATKAVKTGVRKAAGSDLLKELRGATSLHQAEAGYALFEKLASQKWESAEGHFYVAYGKYGKSSDFGAGRLFCPFTRDSSNTCAFLPAFKVEALL